jgi:hypothetical protein
MGGYVSAEREGRSGGGRRGGPGRGRPSETDSGDDDWTAAAVAALPADDFDFDASNARFDKAAVFAAMRSDDATQPEARLVYANKVRSGAAPAPKLGVRENVLDGLVLPIRTPAAPPTPTPAPALAPAATVTLLASTGVPVPTITAAQQRRLDGLLGTLHGRAHLRKATVQC